jgi:antitoxin ParD1/3/4
MNISLTPELEKYVHDKVKSGKYASASEVIREMIRKESDNQEKFLRLKADLDLGMDDIRNGRVVDGETAMAKLDAELRKGMNDAT